MPEQWINPKYADLVANYRQDLIALPDGTVVARAVRGFLVPSAQSADEDQ